MRPIFLEIKAFGPYVEKQTVDFEKLKEHGMFLIKGSTGSGKTTIFDAITFALYGGGSGEDSKTKTGRNDFSQWRCTQAPKDAETVVSFTFEVRNQKYIFTRKLIPKKVNLSVKLEGGRVDEDGTVIPFFENPKEKELNSKAEELIGLTKEQFRQVVLLPQGQFERFLTASSDEKEVILQKIFNVYKWKSYAENFYLHAKEKKDSIDLLKTEIEASLSDEGVDSLEGLSEKQGILKKEKEALYDNHEKYDGRKRQEALNADILLAEQFARLHEIEREKVNLEKREVKIESLKESYEDSKRAEKLRDPLKTFSFKKEEHERRVSELKSNKEKLQIAKEEEKNAEENLAGHMKGSKAEELSKKISYLEEKAPVYEKIDALRDEYCSKAEEYEKACANYTEAEKKCKLALEKAEKAKESFDEADRKAKEYRDRYFAGIYGEIASDLKDGEKCPVCGSTEHPLPALKSSDSISKEEVEVEEKAAELKKKEWDAKEKDRALCLDEEKSQRDALSIKAEEKNKAKISFEAAKDNLVSGISDSAELKKEILVAKKEKENFEKETDRLQKLRDTKKEDRAAFEEKCRVSDKEAEEAKESFKEAEKELIALLKENSFETGEEALSLLTDDETRDEWHEKIVSYEKLCDKNRKEYQAQLTLLTDKTEPDKELFKARQEEISEESRKYEAFNSRIESEMLRLGEKSKILEEKKALFDKDIHQAEEDLAFARKLRGDTGIGIQRYVLAIMFNQVIGEANRMLSKVHGGRYYLFRSDDKGAGNKRGLELKIHDSRSPENDGRSVAMLSGGEKFLVSLALSIGMSTVAMKSGVQIEALFIDEGFGTLDESSISDAMDVLYSVRKGNGMIGIISHVKLLEDNIPSHIEVKKTEQGSSICVV